MISSDLKLIQWLTDEIISWIYKDMSVYQSYLVGTNNLCLAFGGVVRVAL